ncbi:MAG: DUF721 domain-containing protein [Bacteroidales bacterium]|nr:DUF721 domain-containing protein [Bacteroidales bacterium]MBR2298921.1 DUF721 domain-containing protein [Bacteroidales bacterium]
MKRTDPIMVDELVAIFTSRLGIRNDLNRIRVYQAWDDVVGFRVARATAKHFYRAEDKILFCTMNSSSLANQLYFQSEIIKKRINEELGENLVEKVVIR